MSEMQQMLDQSDMDVKSSLHHLLKHVLKIEVTKKFEVKASEIVHHFKTQEDAVKKKVGYAKRCDLLDVLKKQADEELIKMDRCLNIVLSFIEQCPIEKLELGTSNELLVNLQRNMPDHEKNCLNDCGFKRIQFCDFKIQTKDEEKYPTVDLKLPDKFEDTNCKKENVLYRKTICFDTDLQSLTEWQRNGELHFTDCISSDELSNEIFSFVTDVFGEKLYGIAKLIPPLLSYKSVKVDWLSTVEFVLEEKIGLSTVIMDNRKGQKHFLEYYNWLYYLYKEKLENENVTKMAHNQENMLKTEEICKYLSASFKQLSRYEENKSSSRTTVLPYFIIKFPSHQELCSRSFRSQSLKKICWWKASLIQHKSTDKMLLFLTVRSCSKFYGIAQLKKVTHDEIEFEWILRMEYIPGDLSIFKCPDEVIILDKQEGIKLFLAYVGHLQKNQENSSTLGSQKFELTSSISFSKSQVEMQTKQDLNLQEVDDGINGMVRVHSTIRGISNYSTKDSNDSKEKISTCPEQNSFNSYEVSTDSNKNAIDFQGNNSTCSKQNLISPKEILMSSKEKSIDLKKKATCSSSALTPKKESFRNLFWHEWNETKLKINFDQMKHFVIILSSEKKPLSGYLDTETLIIKNSRISCELAAESVDFQQTNLLYITVQGSHSFYGVGELIGLIGNEIKCEWICRAEYRPPCISVLKNASYGLKKLNKDEGCKLLLEYGDQPDVKEERKKVETRTSPSTSTSDPLTQSASHTMTKSMKESLHDSEERLEQHQQSEKSDDNSIVSHQSTLNGVKMTFKYLFWHDWNRLKSEINSGEMRHFVIIFSSDEELFRHFTGSDDSETVPLKSYHLCRALAEGNIVADQIVLLYFTVSNSYIFNGIGLLSKRLSSDEVEFEWICRAEYRPPYESILKCEVCYSLKKLNKHEGCKLLLEYGDQPDVEEERKKIETRTSPSTSTSDPLTQSASHTMTKSMKESLHDSEERLEQHQQSEKSDDNSIVSQSTLNGVEMSFKNLFWHDWNLFKTKMNSLEMRHFVIIFSSVEELFRHFTGSDDSETVPLKSYHLCRALAEGNIVADQLVLLYFTVSNSYFFNGIGLLSKRLSSDEVEFEWICKAEFRPSYISSLICYGGKDSVTLKKDVGFELLKDYGNELEGARDKQRTDSITESSSALPSESTREKPHLTVQRRDQSHQGAGLRNLINTCYMNCILQCLARTRLSNLDQNFFRNDDLLEAFSWLIHALNDTNNQFTVNPEKLKAEIGKFSERFSNYRQQDAHEFLLCFLEELSKRMKRTSGGHSGQQEAPNIIQEFFAGKMTSTVKGRGKCIHSLETEQPFYSVCLAIPQMNYPRRFWTDGVGLDTCWKHFTRLEKMEGDNQIMCIKCPVNNQFHDATLQLSVSTFPKVLIININRFDLGRRQKLDTEVSFPIKDLMFNSRGDILDSRSNELAHRYDLIGFCEHSGDLQFGHYWAVVKSRVTDKWHRYSDSWVNEFRMESENTHRSKNVSILFYERCKETSC